MEEQKSVGGIARALVDVRESKRLTTGGVSDLEVMGLKGKARKVGESLIGGAQTLHAYRD